MATTLRLQRLAKLAPSCNVPVHVYRSMARIAAYSLVLLHDAIAGAGHARSINSPTPFLRPLP